MKLQILPTHTPDTAGVRFRMGHSPQPTRQQSRRALCATSKPLHMTSIGVIMGDFLPTHPPDTVLCCCSGLSEACQGHATLMGVIMGDFLPPPLLCGGVAMLHCCPEGFLRPAKSTWVPLWPQWAPEWPFRPQKLQLPSEALSWASLGSTWAWKTCDESNLWMKNQQIITLNLSSNFFKERIGFF